MIFAAFESIANKIGNTPNEGYFFAVIVHNIIVYPNVSPMRFVTNVTSVTSVASVTNVTL